MLGRRAAPEQAQLADLHAWPQLDRESGDIGQLESDVAGEAGVDPAGCGMRQQPKAAKA
jgi:hypothetical protein